MDDQRDRDFQERHAALSQACHDCRGLTGPQEVVARAKIYLSFLRDAYPKA